jgi:hypothetical protein
MSITHPDQQRSTPTHLPPPNDASGRHLLRACLLLGLLIGGAANAQSIITDVEPVMLAGGYYVSPSDSPAARIDPNTTDSPFGGVGSLGVDGVFRATAVLISRRHILTAGHAIDENNDGISDVAPQRVTFRLNLGGNSTHIIGITQIAIHPDFTGFENPTLNDDIAVLTLSQDAPLDAPIYELHRRPMRQGDVLVLVGYGRTGYGDLGFRLPFENFNVKRWGQNVADLSFLDDDGTGFAEVYVFDFDGPDGTTNITGGPTLGNTLETTLGFGDSGGPALIWEDGAYRLAGINTFIGRFTGQPFLAPMFGSAGGGSMIFPAGQWIASQAGLNWDLNMLRLNVHGTPVYIRPGQTVTVDIDAMNLAQKVTALQAFLNFSSAHFATAPGSVIVAAGGGVWNELVYDVYNAGGDLDVGIGVDLRLSGGTDVDGTTATITLTATGEGTTHIVFRPDPRPDPGLTHTTLFSNETGLSVIPVKIDGQPIVIDGSDPVMSDLAITQNQVDVSNGLAVAVQGTINISFAATDATAGLAGTPAVTLTLGPDSIPVTFLNEAPSGTFNYAAEITTATENGSWNLTAIGTDRAGNQASLQTSLCVNKNQIRGQVELDGFVGTGVGHTREVTFVATGGTRKSWTLELTNSSGAVFSYILTDVPTGTTALSAKTRWNLRSRLGASLDAQGQAPAVDFVGPEQLLGGDFDGSNMVNILDYSLMKTYWGPGIIADLNGDGMTGTMDYTVLQRNWFKRGNAE